MTRCPNLIGTLRQLLRPSHRCSRRRFTQDLPGLSGPASRLPRPGLYLRPSRL